MALARSVEKFMAYAMSRKGVKSGLFFWTVLALVLAGTFVMSNIPLGLYTPTVGFQQKKHRIPPIEIPPPSIVSPAGHGIVRTLRQRIVAIGDLHGDVDRLRSVLRAAHVLQEGKDAWREGCTDIVVQLGNVVGSGPDAPKMLLLLSRLKTQALAHGGRLITLSGNHELLALSGVSNHMHPHILKLTAGEAGFRQLYSSSGRYGSIIAEENLVAAIVSDIVFVHGGLTATYARRGIRALNSEWYEETAKHNLTSHLFHDTQSPFSDHSVLQAAMSGDCAPLLSSLAALEEKERIHVNLMVVGHTTTEKGKVGIWCDGKLMSIDVGMSRYVEGGGYEAFVSFQPMLKKGAKGQMLSPQARLQIHYPLGIGKRAGSLSR